MSERPEDSEVQARHEVPASSNISINAAPVAQQINTSLPSISSILSTNSDHQGYVQFPSQPHQPANGYSHQAPTSTTFPYQQQEEVNIASGYYQPPGPATWSNFPPAGTFNGHPPPNTHLPMNQLYSTPYPQYIQRPSNEGLPSADIFRKDQSSNPVQGPSLGMPLPANPVLGARDIDNGSGKFLTPINEIHRYSNVTAEPVNISNGVNGLHNTNSASVNSLHGAHANPSLNNNNQPNIHSSHGYQENFSQRSAIPSEESFSGPPKTSRFFKSVSPEVNRHPEIPGFGFVGSSHHYNPYLYPQNKSKQYQGCDFVGVVTGEFYKSLFVTSYAIKNREDIPLNDDLPQIPLLRPTLAEFQNPIQYIESLQSLGEKHGAVKIIPPLSWDTKSSLNSELVWFKTRRQLWNGYENEMRARLEFHTNLHKFLATEGMSSYKLPSIDRRTLDLFRFRAVVNLRGGFVDVCNKKLWAQIGREMGYSGRITSSLSSSLKSHYQRILYKFDKYMERKVAEESQERVKVESNQVDGQFPVQSLPNEGNGSSQKRSFEDLCIQEFSVDQSIGKKVKTENIVENGNSNGSSDAEAKKVNVPLVIASSTQIFRPKQSLYRKGYNPYFDTVTDQRPGITVDDDQTLPAYDFYKWHDMDKTIDDASPHDSKVSPLYNLKQFYEKSLKMESLFLEHYSDPGESYQSNFRTFERLFWKMLETPEIRLEAEASVQLPTGIHESGFPVPDRYESESSKQNRTVLDAWNLNNLPVSDSSVFQFLRGDHESLLHPHLRCNMFFSSQSWNMEDHFLYNVDYNHLGAKKLWYFIPESSREKYEALLEKYIEIKNNQTSDIPDMLDEFKNGFSTDSAEYVSAIYDNQPFSTSKKPRARHLNPLFNQFISEEPYNPYHSDIFLPPSILRENGIEVYGTYQSEREFIVRFPKAYSANISFGFNVSESVPLAPPSWLNVAEEGVSWLSKQQIPSRFSVLRILLDIISNCNDNLIVQAAKPVFQKLCSEEMARRQEIRGMSQVKEVSKVASLDTRDPLTDADLIDTFPSCICLRDKEDPVSTFTMSLRYFLDKEVYNQTDKYLFELHTFISDESLRHADKLIASNAITSDEWYQKFKNAIQGYDKPSLKSMNSLYSEGEPAFKHASDVDKVSPEFQKALKSFENLGEYIKETEDWNRKAKVFLDSRLQTKLRGNKRRGAKESEAEEKEKERKKQEEKHLWKSVDELNDLINQIYDLPLSVPEMDQLIEFAGAVEDYEVSARNLLGNGVGNSAQADDDIEGLIVLGESFSLKLDSLVLLERILKRRRWLKKASQLDSISDTAELKELIDEGESVCSGSDHYKMLSLTELYDRVLKVNSELKDLISPSNGVVSVELITNTYQRYKNLPIDQELKSKYFDLTQTHTKLKDFLERLPEISKSIQEEMEGAEGDLKRLLDLSSKRFKRLFFDDFIADVLKDSSSFTDMPTQFLSQSFVAFREWYKDFTEGFSLVMVDPVENEDRSSKVKMNKDKLKELKDKCTPCMAISQDKKSDFFVEGSSINEKRYCFCRMPENGYMIECDKCTEWFHFSCVGYDESMEEFICAMCDNEGSLVTTSKHLKDMEGCITFDGMKDLYERSKFFFIFAEEYDQFLELLKMGFEFSNKLKQVLVWEGDKCVDLDLNKVIFYLRKVEGCSIIMDVERNALREQFRHLRALNESRKIETPVLVKEEEVKKEEEQTPYPVAVKDEVHPFEEAPAASSAEVATTGFPDPVTHALSSGVTVDVLPEATTEGSTPADIAQSELLAEVAPATLATEIAVETPAEKVTVEAAVVKADEQVSDDRVVLDSDAAKSTTSEVVIKTEVEEEEQSSKMESI